MSDEKRYGECAEWCMFEDMDGSYILDETCYEYCLEHGAPPPDDPVTDGEWDELCEELCEPADFSEFCQFFC